MKFTVAAILALSAVPAHSLSYLESIGSGRAPAVSSAAPAAAAEPPFFFTSGAKDEPAETPDFFFTNGSPAVSSGNYMESLAATSGAPSGAGMASYLDSLPKNAPPSNAGSGMASYTDALSAGKAPVASAPAPAAPAPVVAKSSSAPIAPGNYMESLAATSGAPTGSGMTSYLDVLPRAPSSMGGAGIPSYTDALPVSNTFAGTGAGMSTYTDNLSGGRVSSGKSFSPYSSKSSARAPAFGMASKGNFVFEIQADAAMIAQIEAAKGRKVRLSGKASLK